MANATKLIELKKRGFEISERDIRRAEREEKRNNRPLPSEPDPLHDLIKQLVDEIQAQALTQTVNTDLILSKVEKGLKEGLKEGFKELKPVKLELPAVAPAKPKKWEFKTKFPNGKLKYVTEVKEI